MNEWLLLAVGILLCFGTGIFVASEFSLVNLDRNELIARQERGERGLGPLIATLERTSTHLSAAQLGITLTTLLTGATFTPAIESLLAPLLTGWGLTPGWVTVLASVLGVVLATIVSMLVGELIPKNTALAIPLQVGKVIAPIQRAFTAVFGPAVAVLNGSANAILRAMGIEPKEELSGARTPEELSSLVRTAASQGSLDEETASLISRTLHIAELTAGDVMTPRSRVEAIDKESTVADLVALAQRTGFSRFPIVDGDLDEVTGVAHLKLAVAVPREKRAEVPVQAIATEVERVPDSLEAEALLSLLKGRGLQLAIVVDEYGGTAGLVTLEDCVEEIIGEVSDEHDRARIDVVRGPGWVTFPGLLRPDEVKERVGIEIPEGHDYETAGGYVVEQLGALPQLGDVAEIEEGTLSVERLDGRRIDRLRFVPRPVLEGEA